MAAQDGEQAFKVDYFRHFTRGACAAGRLADDFTTRGGRYAARRLYELGCVWVTIGAITGHRTIAMVREYAGKRRCRKRKTNRLGAGA